MNSSTWFPLADVHDATTTFAFGQYTRTYREFRSAAIVAWWHTLRKDTPSIFPSTEPGTGHTVRFGFHDTSYTCQGVWLSIIV
jgi:hypothetical protein